MTDDHGHVKLRIGELELEYQGATSFIRTGLVDLVREVAQLRDEQQDPAIPEEPPTLRSEQSDAAGTEGKLDLSIVSIASRLKAKSGPDLVIAAAAFLTLCAGKEVFSRDEIRETMKAAHGYYKQTMSKNLTNSVQSLLRQDRLRQTREDQFTLASPERESLNAALTDDQ